MDLSAVDRARLLGFIRDGGPPLTPVSREAFEDVLDVLRTALATQAAASVSYTVTGGPSVASYSLFTGADVAARFVRETAQPQRKLDLQTSIALLGLLVAILALLNDFYGSDSLTKQDAQQIVEQAIKSVQTDQPPVEVIQTQPTTNSGLDNCENPAPMTDQGP
jgi:hypothetical protein